MEYASDAKANAGLATGIIGTALGALNGMGGLATLSGASLNSSNGENSPVTRYELNYVRELAEKDHTISKFESAQYTDAAIKGLSDQLAVKFNQIDNKFTNVDSAINTQAVLNATTTATIQCMQGNIATLMSMTKVVIPNANVTPGWGDVTITPSGSATVKGAIPSSNG